jgi:hypothetical protein
LRRAKTENESQDLMALAKSDPASRTPGFDDVVVRTAFPSPGFGGALSVRVGR